MVKNVNSPMNSNIGHYNANNAKMWQNSVGIVKYNQKSYFENFIWIGWKSTEIFCLQANHQKFF